MQTTFLRIWTRLADFVFKDDSRYSKCASSLTLLRHAEIEGESSCCIQSHQTRLKWDSCIRGLDEMFTRSHHITCWCLLLSTRSKHCNIDGRAVWSARKTILKNKPHLVTFDESILVRLWTFQAILVNLRGIQLMDSLSTLTF